eukprot:gene7412-5220_t
MCIIILHHDDPSSSPHTHPSRDSHVFPLFPLALFPAVTKRSNYLERIETCQQKNRFEGMRARCSHPEGCDRSGIELIFVVPQEGLRSGCCVVNYLLLFSLFRFVWHKTAGQGSVASHRNITKKNMKRKNERPHDPILERPGLALSHVPVVGTLKFSTAEIFFMASSSADDVPDVSGWIIFLDVDGVLLPVPRFSFGGGELDGRCICRLQHIIEEALQGEHAEECRSGGPLVHPVTIILSSTWRNFPDMIARLNSMFVRYGAGTIPPVAGGTPKETVLVTQVSYYADHPSEQRLVRDRVDEIYAWLHEHVADHPEGIGGRWIAIDDMQLDVDERMKGHFLKTETETGLVDEDIERAVDIARQLPTVAVAQERAIAARTDPTLFQEKLEIEKVLRERLEAEVQTLRETTAAQAEKIQSLSEQLRTTQRSEAEWKRRHEEVSYRLALEDFSKRHPTLQAAVNLAHRSSGPTRKAVDQRISNFVQLLRQKKELEKKIRAPKKKELQQAKTMERTQEIDQPLSETTTKEDPTGEGEPKMIPVRLFVVVYVVVCETPCLSSRLWETLKPKLAAIDLFHLSVRFACFAFIFLFSLARESIPIPLSFAIIITIIRPSFLFLFHFLSSSFTHHKYTVRHRHSLSLPLFRIFRFASSTPLISATFICRPSSSLAGFRAPKCSTGQETSSSPPASVGGTTASWRQSAGGAPPLCRVAGQQLGSAGPIAGFKSPTTRTSSSSLSVGQQRQVVYPECRGETQDEMLRLRLAKRTAIDYHQPPTAGRRSTNNAPMAEDEIGALVSGAPQPRADAVAASNGTTENGSGGGEEVPAAASPQEKEEEEETTAPTTIVSRHPVSPDGMLYFQVETDGATRHESVGIIVIDVETPAVMMFDRLGRQHGNRPYPGYPLRHEDVDRVKAGETLKVGTKPVLIITALCEDVFRSGEFFLRSEHELRIREDKAKAKQAAEQEKQRVKAKMSFGAGPGFMPPPQFRKRPRDGETGFTVPLAGRPKVGRNGLLLEELKPLHDPDRPQAVVLFRADYKRDIQGRRQVSVVVDPIIGDKLRPHQITGVKFLYDCIVGARVEGYHGAILADEMGLGKTIQTVATIYTCLKQGKFGMPTARKCLVITPSSLVKNWCNEFDKWLGEGSVKHFAIAESTPKSDRIISRFDGEGDVLVISYDQLRKHIQRLSSLTSVELVVCDEGHRLKNAEVKTTRAVDQLPTRNRIILSGTPIQNDLSEFHAMVNFVNPGVLGNRDLFSRVFEEPVLSGRDPEAPDHLRALGRDRAHYLSHLTQKFILRRTQSINESYLPPKVDVTVFVRLGTLQQQAYLKLSNLVMQQADYEAGDGSKCRPLVLISALRKLCNHLDLFHDAIELSHKPSESSGNGGDKGENKPRRGAPPHTSDSGIPRALLPTGYKKGSLQQDSGSKMFFVSLMLDQLRRSPERDKLVIVSNFTQTLNIIAALCQSKKVAYFQLDGSTPIKRRQELVDYFNVPASQEIVFLLSSKAGGVGLNLIGANRLILFDPDWNPANDAQAMGRVWRDGQKKRVYIYRLLTTGTIEEKVYQRQVSKQGLSANVVDMQEDSKQHFTLEELKSLFAFKPDTLSDTHDLLHCKNCEATAAAAAKRAKESAQMTGFRNVGGEDGKTKQSGPRMDELKAWRHISTVAQFNLDAVMRFIASQAPSLVSFLFADERDNTKKKIENCLQVERPFATDEDPIVCASQVAIDAVERQETEIEIITSESSDCSDGD